MLFTVSNLELDEFFLKIKEKLIQDPENNCLVFEKLKEVAAAFCSQEKAQAHNFQVKYLEIRPFLICSKFSRYHAEIMKYIEQITCSESWSPRLRENPNPSAKKIIESFK